MEFRFETIYDQKAITAMVRALRKTLRKKRSRRSQILGGVVVVLGLFLAWPIEDGKLRIEASNLITWIAVLILLFVLAFEDQLNAYIARRRMMKGTGKAVAVFTEQSYRSESEAGKSEWPYETIAALAQTEEYFVFLFDQSHGQVYDKASLTGGSEEAFRKFISERTGLEWVSLR